jgi:peptide/nickel transport system permease protein
VATTEAVRLEGGKGPAPGAAAVRAPGRQLKLGASFIIPAMLFGIIILVAALAPVLAPYPPNQGALEDSLLPPAWVSGGTHAHLLGTDIQGRDLLSRLIYGARLSLSVSVAGILVGGIIGSTAGVMAGYYGGFLDRIVTQVIDLSMGVPMILLALVLAAVFGANVINVVIVASFLLWPLFARQLRAEARALRELDYVNLARVAGLSDHKIILRHIFPGTISTLTVIATLQFGTVIILESSLSFLGVGVPPDQASWGGTISSGLTQLIIGNWWISVFPGGMLSITALSINLLGDWLRDALDPRLRSL